MNPTANTILVLNSGSSSLKFGLYRAGSKDEELLFEGSADGIGRENGSLRIGAANGDEIVRQEHVLESQQEALSRIAQALRDHDDATPVAIGHRVVHGGPKLRSHQRITDEVVAVLEQSVHFAPLHIPQALKLIHQAEKIFPEASQFACFDTVFHRTIPPVAAHLPLPDQYFQQGVQRYGFHGLSYESLVYRLRGSLPARAVFAHLGSGASVAAVSHGRSVDTSMGLTPTGGFPMGTRSGDLDPGVLLYLMRSQGLDADALEDLLNRRAGLAGLSGGESNMQELLRRASLGDEPARLAVDTFCVAVRKYIGAYAALMGGLDLLVFTGGIGEHSQEIRTRIVEGLGFLGLDSMAGADRRVLAIASGEEIQIARHTRTLLGGEGRVQADKGKPA